MPFQNAGYSLDQYENPNQLRQSYLTNATSAARLQDNAHHVSLKSEYSAFSHHQYAPRVIPSPVYPPTTASGYASASSSSSSSSSTSATPLIHAGSSGASVIGGDSGQYSTTTTTTTTTRLPPLSSFDAHTEPPPLSLMSIGPAPAPKINPIKQEAPAGNESFSAASTSSTVSHPETGDDQVEFDTTNKAFYHPGCTIPEPIPEDKETVLELIKQHKSSPKRSSAKIHIGDGNSQFYFGTASKRNNRHIRITPHDKTQGRPYGAGSTLLFKLVRDVKQLYKCASHGKDAMESVICEQYIHTDDLRETQHQSRSRKRTHVGKYKYDTTWGPVEMPADEESFNVPDFVTRQVVNPTTGVGTVTVRVWHYEKIGKAIAYHFANFGIKDDNYTYYEVIRASSSLGTVERQLTGNKKVMKIISRPIPPPQIHDVIHLKANICYPRYKKSMTLYITPGATRFPYAYYASDTLWDQERLIGTDMADTIYCGPSMLGIDTPTPYYDRLISRYYLLTSENANIGMSDTKRRKDQVPQQHSRFQAQLISKNLKVYKELVLQNQGIDVELFKPGITQRTHIWMNGDREGTSSNSSQKRRKSAPASASASTDFHTPPLQKIMSDGDATMTGHEDEMAANGLIELHRRASFE